MKILCISDTHLTTSLSNLPEADILIHAGDALNFGSMSDLIEFKSHLMNIHSRYKNIIFTPGNHDCVFENNFNSVAKFIEEVPGLTVLHDKSIVIDGVKFYGTAWQPFFCDWAFNVGEWKFEDGIKLNWTDSEKLVQHYSRIPDDTEVLITHCPPFGILDNVGNVEKSGRRCGSWELINRVAELKSLKLHVFGHIHYSHGMEERLGVKYINAATCSEDYDPVNEPIMIDIGTQL